jgi:uncharacterized coiled-coil protein SlyX
MSDVKNTQVKTEDRRLNKAIADLRKTLSKLQDRIAKLEKKVG